MGAQRRAWRSDREEKATWRSGAVATAVTGAVFAAAFLSMTATRSLRVDASRRETSPPAPLVLLPRPAPEIPTRTVVPAPAAPAAPTATVTEPVTAPPLPATNPEPVRDSGAARAPAPPLDRSVLVPRFTRVIPSFDTTASSGPRHAAGAPIGPAGVTFRGSALSVRARDSIAAEGSASVPFFAAKRKITAEEKSQLKGQMEPGLAPYSRGARLPGEPVYVPLMNGGYAVGVAGINLHGGKIDRRGPDSLDAQYQAYLRRMEDRLLLRRDSIRADSLRRDSIVPAARPP